MRNSRLPLGGILPVLLAVCVAMLGNRTPLAAQTVIYENNFDHRSAGPYTDTELDEDFDEPNFNNGVTEGRVSVVSGSEAFGGTGSALAIEYPGGLAGTGDTGAQWRLSFAESFEEATFSFRVRFAPGFDFVRGGKFPGLAGGTSPTGSTQATGLNGWTGRMMWRTEFNGVSGNPLQPVTYGITYAKHTTSGFAGDGVQEDRSYFFNPDGSRPVMVPDQWYQITQRIKMNTPGQFDGIQQIWLDGVLVIDERDLQFRLTDAFAIDQLYFSTFFGGGFDWRTSKDEVAYFDDFLITVPDPDSDPVDDDETDPVDPEDLPLSVPRPFATIDAAIEAAQPGDTIQLSGEIVESLVIRKSIRLQGDPNTIVIGKDPGEPAIIVNTSDVELVGFEIFGGTNGVLVRSDSDNVLLDNLFVNQTTSVGISVQSDCSDLVIRNTEVRESAGDGIRINSCDNLTLQGNDSNRNQGHGYFLRFCDDADCIDNEAFLNQQHGYRLSGDRHSLADNISIRNGSRGYSYDGGTGHVLLDNLARDNDSHGFSFESVTNGQFIDNRARFNGGHGFRVWNNSNSNVLDDSNSTGNVLHGILAGQSSGNTIVNSFIFENLRRGILLSSSASSHVVSSNIVRANVEGGISDFGDDNQVDESNRIED